MSGLGANGYPGSYYPYRQRLGGYTSGYNNYNNGYNSGYYNTGYLGGAQTYPYGGVGYQAGGGYY